MTAVLPPPAPPAEKMRQRRVDTRKSGRAVENADYKQMLSRLIRALARRAGRGDAEDLALVASLFRELDSALREAVAQQRKHGDVSWARIAAELGITRQAAQQRFGKRGARGQG